MWWCRRRTWVNGCAEEAREGRGYKTAGSIYTIVYYQVRIFMISRKKESDKGQRERRTSFWLLQQEVVSGDGVSGGFGGDNDRRASAPRQRPGGGDETLSQFLDTCSLITCSYVSDAKSYTAPKHIVSS